ncbi:hypothetical protein ARGLB_012_00210 [Arthrobacter globiformis NBRC 12137]|uniref:DUF3854 domain-containing protein n=1 Tax=Arthrobacter globiformis (strain ATCC 8010 / DSM 20124 / JCM 1332 / NBRC 12137 / NCIMB 8907 / NRRL B-2979 / 168) TaxID=1077972 RepID=H0QHM6_ARTG1|nr:hypothetical protein ARGLB_012_00210 [Arthrobacter globiformis NBRC 12137]
MAKPVPAMPEPAITIPEDQRRPRRTKENSPAETGLPPWEASDYAASITGSGAFKLKDSGVAPLVAAARGYTRIDKTNYAEMARKMQVVGNSSQGKRFKRTLSAPGKDGMVMPWYSLAGIVKAKRENERPVPHTYQVRPEFPENNDAGKPLKYEFVANVGTPLDLHPAIPTEWVDTTPVVMFAEGMLKGDSALSAYLVHNGISYSELRSEGVENPVAKLRELLERIPHDERVLIVSIGGVYNASGNAVDWREIALKDRIGWIAFDADISVNPAVHAAANKLSAQLSEKSRMSEILYLNPEVTSGDDGSMAKAGVDDFLARSGNWAALIALLDDVMPDAPAKNEEDRPGAWRVSSNGQFVEECVPLRTGAGGTIEAYRWDRRVDLGGRVLAMETRRQPTDQELKTGVFDPNVKSEDIDDAHVEIEISWHLNGQDRSVIVSGPETMLSYKPEDWHRQKASLPRELLLHPEWPPRGDRGANWLKAVKRHRPDEASFKTRWMQMGWVPVEDGDPVFLVGDQIIGSEDSRGTAVPGITDREIESARKYGVGDNLAGDYEDPAFREEVRNNFHAVMDTYIHAKAWTDLATATVVLAGALRPAIPIRPKATIYVWGPKGKGKSWTAECMMHFWARHRGDWHEELPGSAKDTAAAMENAVARTPIWVIDDLAPSALRRQAEQEDAKLADITRAIFNNASKLRMNADMTSKKANKPMTQLILTAENELSTPSAKERLIPLYLGQGKLNKDKGPTDALNDIARDHGTPARFTAQMIKYIRFAATRHPGGWAAFVSAMEGGRSQLKHQISSLMKENGATSGSLERTSTLAADVLLTFFILENLSRELDMGSEFAKQFRVNSPMSMSVIQLVTDAHTNNQEEAPGVSLLTALAALLSSGKAHVISGDDPSRAPIEGTEQSEAMTNHRLGWVAGGPDGSLRSAGESIGTVVTVKRQKVVLFDKVTAFDAAKKAYPSLVKHGQGPSAAWSGIWDEGLAADVKRPFKSTTGTPLNVYGYKTKTGTRFEGIPVAVSRLLDRGPLPQELTQEEGQD